MNNCNHCDREREKGVPRCGFCGAKLSDTPAASGYSVKCPGCDNINYDKSKKECVYCGKPLPDTKGDQAAPPDDLSRGPEEIPDPPEDTSDKDDTMINSDFKPVWPEEKETVEYADYFKRTFAVLIDSMILSVIVIIPYFVLGVIMAVAGIPLELLSLWVVLAVWLYSAMLESSGMRATPGKRAMGIIVTDLEGKKISFGRASGRFWAKSLSALTFFIGYLMIFFTEKRQTLHDMLSGCVVIVKPPAD